MFKREAPIGCYTRLCLSGQWGRPAAGEGHTEGRRGGKLKGTVPAKGDFVSVANHSRSRWGHIGHDINPRIPDTLSLHRVINCPRIAEFQRELRIPRRVHPPPESECRTEWLGLTFQKPRLCLEDDKWTQLFYDVWGQLPKAYEPSHSLITTYIPSPKSDFRVQNLYEINLGTICI